MDKEFGEDDYSAFGKLRMWKPWQKLTGRRQKWFCNAFYDDNESMMTLVEGEIADEIMDEQNMMDNMGQDMVGIAQWEKLNNFQK